MFDLGIILDSFGVLAFQDSVYGTYGTDEAKWHRCYLIRYWEK